MFYLTGPRRGMIEAWKTPFPSRSTVIPPSTHLFVVTKKLFPLAFLEKKFSTPAVLVQKTFQGMYVLKKNYTNLILIHPLYYNPFSFLDCIVSLRTEALLFCFISIWGDLQEEKFLHAVFRKSELCFLRSLTLDFLMRVLFPLVKKRTKDIHQKKKLRQPRLPAFERLHHSHKMIL